MHEYFPPEVRSVEGGVAMELRAILAWELLKTNGVLMAKPDGEDSSGRQQLKPMPPQELVDRAIEVANIFVDKCETRGYIRPTTMTVEEAAAVAGRLSRVRDDAQYERVEVKQSLKETSHG